MIDAVDEDRRVRGITGTFALHLPESFAKAGEGGREEEEENVVIITDSHPGTQELLSVHELESVRSGNRLFLHPQRS